MEGKQGCKGEMRIKGVKGDNGPPGPRGDAGDRGPRGRIGIQLYNYTNVISGNCMYVLLGDPGYPGPPGQTGLRGDRGQKGKVVITMALYLILYILQMIKETVDKEETLVTGGLEAQQVGSFAVNKNQCM